jgi:hypothetical protein
VWIIALTDTFVHARLHTRLDASKAQTAPQR